MIGKALQVMCISLALEPYLGVLKNKLLLHCQLLKQNLWQPLHVLVNEYG